jgi:cold-inducible RNA-binding protein
MAKLYVGNLPYRTTEEAVKEFFSQCGEVVSVALISDRDTGRAKGFGFVEMSSEEEAKKAVAELNEKEFEGRNLRVDLARPKE